MFLIHKNRKKIAVFMAINLLVEIISPNVAWALTGGPSQPEVDSFEPVNTTQMVDLFSGDFNYNIPLLDVGGYPVNMAYHSGVGMEQEASWVGLGWNINVGNITRSMRGLPDDFNGDTIKKEFNIRPNRTWGVNVGLDLQILGLSKSKQDKYNDTKTGGKDAQAKIDAMKKDDTAGLAKLTSLVDGADQSMLSTDQAGKFSLDLGVFHNSYKGLGLSLSLSMKIAQASKLGQGSIGMGFNSQSGSDINFDITCNKKGKDANSSGWQGGLGLGYNSLDGLKAVSFSLSQNYDKSSSKKKVVQGIFNGSSSVPIGMVSYVPNYQFSMKNASLQLNMTLGSELTGLHGNIRIGGNYSNQWLADRSKIYRAYGYLNDQEKMHGVTESNSDDLMLDFNRFNDRNFDKLVTNLPMSTGMYDVYSVQGQGTGGSFRPFKNKAGIYFDPTIKSAQGLNQLDIGVELGVGGNAHYGVPISMGGSNSISGPWRDDNDLFGDDFTAIEDQTYEGIYFKSAGDGGPLELNNYNNFGGDNPARFELKKIENATRVFNRRKFAKINKNYFTEEVVGEKSKWQNKSIPTFKNNHRVSRNSTINYLTNEEAQYGMAMDEDRTSYNRPRFWEEGGNRSTQVIGRFGAGKSKPQRYHIGEITQTNPEGTRYVYGLPQINSYQREAVFNIARNYSAKDGSNHNNIIEREKELAAYKPKFDDNINNKRGTDNFYQGTIMPAYAHSYLLTEVLSPDYVDVTGNGVSDDDLGTAVKFNYTRTTDKYKWRTPYEENRGRYNAGHLCDPSDDKVNFIYGEKELWYLHSIESKTHVAIFKLSARNDGYGVKGDSGGLGNTDNNKMMKLDSIILYSKLDLIANRGNATPVKTVVFTYGYDLCKDIPNHKDFSAGSPTNKGKLTLKQIYFTYGKNNRGSISPYKFTYSNYNPKYSQAQFDCWGNYKKASQGVPCREYPYSDPLADTTQLDSASMAWSLQKIELPSGGKINVEYEADDYAYVQDKKAMDMVMVEGMAKNSGGIENSGKQMIYGDDRQSHTYIYFKNPNPDYFNSDERIRNNLFRDEKGNYLVQMYYRMKVNMNPHPDKDQADGWEYISGWAAIKWITDGPHVGRSNDKIWVEVEDVKQGDVGISRAHPIAKAAWQTALSELRPIVFPGSAPNQTGKSAFLGLLNSFSTALNIFTGPYENLRWKKIAQLFVPKHSYIRIFNHSGFKRGGGSRVKKLFLEDNWNNMNTSESGASYGQEFSYRSKNTFNQDISSGVASWEPQLGGDQNPFHQPIFQIQKVAMGPNRSLFQETPFMEQLYPGASVGYSNVKVTSISNGSSPRSSTGYTVNEFFTAKDFPVREQWTDIQRLTNGGGLVKFLKKALSPIVKDAQAASQGYVLELNDMHGKPKSVKTYGEMSSETGGINLIAGNEYIYQTQNDDNHAPMNNFVNMLNDSGRIQKREISTEYDVSYDTRKSFSSNWHGGTKLGFDNSGMFVIPHAWPKIKKTTNLLQTVVVCKVIQRYGVIKAVKAFDYGSEVTTENLLWDKETGSVLLTKTTNEFNDNIYNFSFPAHLAYDGMGPAYKNLDYAALNMVVDTLGKCNVSNSDLFVPGDELLMKTGDSYSRGWVLKSGNNKIRIIDRTGKPIAANNYFIRIIRSGRRNMQSVPVGAITTMHNPLNLTTGKLELDQKIVNTSAVEYSQEWPGSVYGGYYFTRVCDTIDPVPELAIVSAYYQLHYGYADVTARFLYKTAGVASPNPINLDSTFSWFDSSKLKRFIDTLFCKGINDSCEKQYFMGRAFNENSYGIQVRYRCDNESPWTYAGPCFYSVTHISFPGGFAGTPARSLIQHGSDPKINGATVYSLTGDTTQQFSMSGNCFVKIIRCHEIINCTYTVGDILNPYINGMRGIWRPKSTYAFVGERQYNFVKDTTDIRHEGIIKNYVPFWTFNDTFKGLHPSGKSNKKWVNSTTATMFSPEGNGLEEVDALGIYKSQLYGYNRTLVTAVAANAKYRQIAFDNFEDYNYSIGPCDIPGHFDFRARMYNTYTEGMIGNGLTIIKNYTYPSHNTYIRKDTAHSGLYSIALKAGISHYATRILDTAIFQKHTPTDTGLFNIKYFNKTIPLFQPDAGVKYLISAWVTEDLTNTNAVNTFTHAKINVKIYNGGAIVDSAVYSPSGMIIEKWQRVTGLFTVPAGADSIRVTLVNATGSVKAGFDDIRINPFNSSMKSYVFNPILLKVMAELDDNNYATFYEYDAEGSLVRVKRETERGIMTVQENRKGIRKTP